MKEENYKSIIGERQILQFDLDYNLTGIFPNIDYIGLFGFSKKEVMAAILNHEYTKQGYYYVVSPMQQEYNTLNDKYKLVLQINKVGLIHNIYTNASDAILNYGNMIYNCFKPEYKHYAYGFYWAKSVTDRSFKIFDICRINRFILHTNEDGSTLLFRNIKHASEYYEISEDEIYDKLFTPTECYRKNEWQFIRTFNNYDDACCRSIDTLLSVNSLNFEDPFSDISCLVRKNDTLKTKEKPSDKDILMIDKDYFEIKRVFLNANEAKRKTGISNIWLCLKHVNGHKTAGGYRWMYRKEYNDLMELM